ncbi:hypothetical protein GQ53DRAFT_133096 [Thozetella sp. PMI_491]|nr:hypothetical protein GQ53DRAFT_133096 [Thozetella sp. PMI_491]
MSGHCWGARLARSSPHRWCRRRLHDRVVLARTSPAFRSPRSSPDLPVLAYWLSLYRRQPEGRPSRGRFLAWGSERNPFLNGKQPLRTHHGPALRDPPDLAKPGLGSRTRQAPGGRKVEGDRHAGMITPAPRGNGRKSPFTSRPYHSRMCYACLCLLCAACCPSGPVPRQVTISSLSLPYYVVWTSAGSRERCKRRGLAANNCVVDSRIAEPSALLAATCQLAWLPAVRAALLRREQRGRIEALGHAGHICLLRRIELKALTGLPQAPPS